MIADNYQCEVSDITSNNLHITDFASLKPGMKLRIPFLSSPVMEVLEETESFISDYYPTLTEKFNEDVKNVVEEQEDIKVSQEVPGVSETVKEKSQIKTINPRYSLYYGNVKPNIPPEYIKKI